MPHDVHFYTIAPEERHAITADDPKLNAPISQEFLPNDYVQIFGEPRMGSHAIDITSPELPPVSEAFTKTFIYGVYDAKQAFWEPMIANSYLETQPNTTTAIKQPQSFNEAGYYPTEYSVKYDEATQEYSVSLDGLTFRPAATPVPFEPSSTLGLLIVGSLSGVNWLKRRLIGQTK